MMPMKATSALVLGIGSVISAPAVAQQPADANTPKVLTDAIVLRGAQFGDASRCDLYISVPYQLLQFNAYEGKMLAEYSVSITVRDSSGRRIIDTTFRRSVLEASYSVSRGTTGKSDNSIRRFTLRPGPYTVETVVADAFGRKDHAGSIDVRVPAYFTSNVELSTPMYVSQIEQRGGRYAITPFVGDVVWSTDMQLFVFLETYIGGQPRRIKHRWTLSRVDGRIAAAGEGDPVPCERIATQSFFPLRIDGRLLPGTYTLRITAHPADASGRADTSVTEASVSRSYVVPRTFAGDVLSDLKKAARQLIYVADQEQIDAIINAKTEGEGLTLFEEFWKGLDPSPGTIRNEAFDEYYSRIDEANKRFKSYNEGWLTDMGRVFIVFGEPLTTERFMGPNGISRIVRWVYPNNIAFTFEDTSGFGDYRLRSGMPGNQKYRYRR
ncbi:MAG: GWxTD domain-containing protein [Candidatus Kapabacteria bacterium]|nr:GWxTD domain-containing protein [Candidatus Kapabacteria bacterium]